MGRDRARVRRVDETVVSGVGVSEAFLVEGKGEGAGPVYSQSLRVDASSSTSRGARWSKRAVSGRRLRGSIG